MRAARLSKARRRQIAKGAAAARKNVKQPSDPKKKYYVATGKPPGLPSRVDSERAIAMYKAGNTLATIGSKFGVSRERVRQILKKHSITSMDGGQVISSFLKTTDKQERKRKATERKERAALRIWGLTLDQYKEFVTKYGTSSQASSPLAKYKSQHSNANKRGIPWQFTFADWWRVWQDSGKWELRGRGKGYCMSRFGDSGPYSKENVYICTIGQNFSDSYLVRRKRTHCKRGHALSGDNKYVAPKNGRVSCRICQKESCKKYDARRRAKL